MTDGFTEQELIQCIPNLRRYAQRLRHKGVDVDDLLQDTLARAWHKRDLFVRHQGNGSLLGWLCTMMHNLGASKTKQLQRENEVISPWPITQSGDLWDVYEAPNTADERALVSDLVRAVESLSPVQQEAIRLVGLEGLTYEEASEVVGVLIGTIRSRISRGRTVARDAYEGNGHIHAWKSHPSTPHTRRCGCGAWQYARARQLR